MPVPVDLWEWGINNRSGRLRTYPSDGVRFNLLPSMKATVTEMGRGRHGGSYYICNKALEERWLDCARQRGNWSVTVSYDPRDRDEIYLHDEAAPSGYQACTLTERSRVDRNLSEWEIGQRQFFWKNRVRPITKRSRSWLPQIFQPELTRWSKKATSEQAGSTASDRSRTSSIRQNRKEERKLVGSKEAFRLGETPPRPAGSAKVIPISTSVSDTYSEPDITEILAKLTADEKGKSDGQ